MNKIIALKGRSNIGKTLTLKRLIELLKNEYDVEDEKHLIDGQDIRVVYRVGKVKIGIETQGDPYSRLFESLTLFQEEGCQLIVCACRSSGSTVEAVRSLKSKYLVSFRGQSSVSLQEWREHCNSAMAGMIFDEVSEAIKA